MALTRKRQQFVTEYLKDFNGTQAAIRAGYSKRTANEQAAALLAIPSIIEAVQSAQAEARSAAIMTLEEAKTILTDLGRTEVKAIPRIKALERLSKMSGWDSPVKVEAEIRTEIILPPDMPKPEDTHNAAD